MAHVTVWIDRDPSHPGYIRVRAHRWHITVAGTHDSSLAEFSIDVAGQSYRDAVVRALRELADTWEQEF